MWGLGGLKRSGHCRGFSKARWSGLVRSQRNSDTWDGNAIAETDVPEPRAYLPPTATLPPIAARLTTEAACTFVESIVGAIARSGWRWSEGRHGTRNGFWIWVPVPLDSTSADFYATMLRHLIGRLDFRMGVQSFVFAQSSSLHAEHRLPGTRSRVQEPSENDLCNFSPFHHTRRARFVVLPWRCFAWRTVLPRTWR